MLIIDYKNVEYILNNEYIMDVYEEINKIKLDNNGLTFHGIKYALNVMNFVEKLLQT